MQCPLAAKPFFQRVLPQVSCSLQTAWRCHPGCLKPCQVSAAEMHSAFQEANQEPQKPCRSAYGAWEGLQMQPGQPRHE